MSVLETGVSHTLDVSVVCSFPFGLLHYFCLETRMSFLFLRRFLLINVDENYKHVSELLDREVDSRPDNITVPGRVPLSSINNSLTYLFISLRFYETVTSVLDCVPPSEKSCVIRPYVT